MNQAVHNKNVSFIWSIADDCLRDIYVRGKYRDVILPMVVLRRLDSLLEPTKEKVLAEVAFQKDDMGLVEPDEKGLQDAAGYVFYNISKWTLKSLFATATNNQQILAHPDFDQKYKNNQDTHNRVLAFQKIFEDVMLKKRRNELELYKLLASDAAFKSAMQQSLRQIVDR
jgi:type I restriction-modification system DNA methylase subunit